MSLSGSTDREEMDKVCGAEKILLSKSSRIIKRTKKMRAKEALAIQYDFILFKDIYMLGGWEARMAGC